MIYLLTALLSLKCYYSYSIYNSQIISTRLYCNPNNPKPEFVNKQKDKPFFVYYPMALTHDPFSPTPDSDIWKEEERRLDDDPIYFKDMVVYSDKIIGKIIKNLEEKGIRDETLILIYSDN